MEQTLDIETPKQKIYKERAIYVGTFLGGPLTAGYLIANNFKAFNEIDKAKKTWIYAIITTIIIFGSLFLIPENVKIPNQIMPLIYTAIAYYLVRHFQGKNISDHISSGGQLYNWWRTILVSLIGLIVTVTPFLGFAFLFDTSIIDSKDTKTFGVTKNEIVFDKKNISIKEINEIGKALSKAAFFDNSATRYVYAKKVVNNFEISISCDKSITNNSEAFDGFVQIRNELQTFFPGNKIIIVLVVDNLDNVIKRIE